MRRLTFAFVVLVGSCVLSAAADARSRVLIMAEDGDAGGQAVAISSTSPVAARTLETLSDAFKAAGFEIFDTRSLSGITKAHDEADLLSAARAAQRPPMDVLVLFSVYTGLRKLSYTTDIHVRVTARMLEVKTGARLGNFEVASPTGWRAPVNCENDCLVEVIGKNAKLLAVDVGTELAHKLAATMPVVTAVPVHTATPGYTLVFSGFSPEDLSGVEEYLVAFKGYKSHQAIADAAAGNAYRYDFGRDSSILDQDLRMMLDRLGTSGRVAFSKVERTFTVEKLPSTQKISQKTAERSPQ